MLRVRGSIEKLHQTGYQTVLDGKDVHHSDSNDLPVTLMVAATKPISLFRISNGWTAGSSAGVSPAKRTLDACGVNKLVQGWLRQNAATSPARPSEL